MYFTSCFFSSILKILRLLLSDILFNIGNILIWRSETYLKAFAIHKTNFQNLSGYKRFLENNDLQILQVLPVTLVIRIFFSFFNLSTKPTIFISKDLYLGQSKISRSWQSSKIEWEILSGGFYWQLQCFITLICKMACSTGK